MNLYPCILLHVAIVTMVVISADGNQKSSGHEESGMKGKGRQVFSHKNVQIYFIDPEDLGATKRDIVTVRLVMIPLEDQNAFSSVIIPPAFLEAGGWFYPLIPSKTPVYRTEEHYYNFPDLLSTSPGASVGIEMPGTMPENVRALFENILLHMAGLDEFPTGFADKFGKPGDSITKTDVACTVADRAKSDEGYSIRSVAHDVGAGVMTVADMAEDGITRGGRNTMDVMANGTEQAKMYLNSTYETAKEYTGNAVGISGDAVKRLSHATTKLASFTGDYITSTASNAYDTVHDESMKGAEAVKHGAFESMGYVYASLHNSGKRMAHAITHNHILDHRYGAADKGHIMELAPNRINASETQATTPKSVDVIN